MSIDSNQIQNKVRLNLDVVNRINSAEEKKERLTSGGTNKSESFKTPNPTVSRPPIINM